MKATNTFLSNVQRSFQLFVFCIFLNAFSAIAGEKKPTSNSPYEKPAVSQGIASFYHDMFSGRKTANGEIFNQQKFTCASNHFPLGTWLRVTNPRNGKSVVVKVNDRMHPRMQRVVDLTKIAAQTLGLEKRGIGKVNIENLGTKLPEITK